MTEGSGPRRTPRRRPTAPLPAPSWNRSKQSDSFKQGTMKASILHSLFRCLGFLTLPQSVVTPATSARGWTDGGLVAFPRLSVGMPVQWISSQSLCCCGPKMQVKDATNKCAQTRLVWSLDSCDVAHFQRPAAPKVPYDANSPSDQRSRADGLGSQFLALLNLHIRPPAHPALLAPPVTLNSLTTRTHLTTISTEIPTNHLRDQHRRQTRSTSEYPHRARASTPHPLPRCACPQH